jgi:hypothetical protein
MQLFMCFMLFQQPLVYCATAKIPYRLWSVPAELRIISRQAYSSVDREQFVR